MKICGCIRASSSVHLLLLPQTTAPHSCVHNTYPIISSTNLSLKMYIFQQFTVTSVHYSWNQHDSVLIRFRLLASKEQYGPHVATKQSLRGSFGLPAVRIRQMCLGRVKVMRVVTLLHLSWRDELASWITAPECKGFCSSPTEEWGGRISLLTYVGLHFKFNISQ